MRHGMCRVWGGARNGVEIGQKMLTSCALWPQLLWSRIGGQGVYCGREVRLEG